MKRIVILGGGESGVGAAVLAQKKGFDVFLSDMSKIKEHYKQMLDEYHIAWEDGQHTEALILNADEEMICDGFGISLTDFFDTPEFRSLEQDIK